MSHKYMPLSEIRQHEPDMKRLKVSQVARSPKGFLPQFKRAKGNPKKLTEHWRTKREGFIARHLVQFEQKPTLRRKLALIAWAYKPR